MNQEDYRKQKFKSEGGRVHQEPEVHPGLGRETMSLEQQEPRAVDDRLESSAAVTALAVVLLDCQLEGPSRLHRNIVSSLGLVGDLDSNLLLSAMDHGCRFKHSGLWQKYVLQRLATSVELIQTATVRFKYLFHFQAFSVLLDRMRLEFC